jgi:eukaryotic-like serine/threonine-protein kinase
LAPGKAALAARLFPVLGRIVDSGEANGREDNSTELREQAFAALAGLLVRISMRAPLVVAIDDLQWGDADSASFLRELLACPRPPAMLLICAYRAEDIDASEMLRSYRKFLEERNPAVTVEQIEVGEFTAAEALEYAACVLGGADPSEMGPLLSEAAGSPLWIAQLARYALGRARNGPDRASLKRGISLQAMLDTTLGELPEPARACWK